MPRNDLIQERGGTAAAWTTANPVLALREPGLETDTGKVKYGDGVTHWNALAYAGGDGGSGLALTSDAMWHMETDGGDTIGLRRIPFTTLPAGWTQDVDGFITPATGDIVPGYWEIVAQVSTQVAEVSGLFIGLLIAGQYLAETPGQRVVGPATVGAFNLNLVVLLQANEMLDFRLSEYPSASSDPIELGQSFLTMRRMVTA